MSDSVWSGQPCGVSGDWTEDVPEPTLENRLAASQYLVERGLAGGTLEDIAYRLTVELAKARNANDEMYELLSNEKERYRARFLMEREFCTDLLDENAELEGSLQLAQEEASQWEKGWDTAQRKLENALAMYDDIAPYINWLEML